MAATLELPGTPGPHKTQQLGPNPHHVVFDLPDEGSRHIAFPPDPDTIGIFEIRRDGTLEALDWVSTEGIRPRFFGIDPTDRRLFAANEVSDTIVGFSLDYNGRTLRSMGTVAVTRPPTSIVWRAAPASR